MVTFLLLVLQWSDIEDRKESMWTSIFLRTDFFSLICNPFHMSLYVFDLCCSLHRAIQTEEEEDKSFYKQSHLGWCANARSVQVCAMKRTMTERWRENTIRLSFAWMSKWKSLQSRHFYQVQMPGYLIFHRLLLFSFTPFTDFMVDLSNWFFSFLAWIVNNAERQTEGVGIEVSFVFSFFFFAVLFSKVQIDPMYNEPIRINLKISSTDWLTVSMKWTESTEMSLKFFFSFERISTSLSLFLFFFGFFGRERERERRRKKWNVFFAFLLIDARWCVESVSMPDDYLLALLPS